MPGTLHIFRRKPDPLEYQVNYNLGANSWVQVFDGAGVEEFLRHSTALPEDDTLRDITSRDLVRIMRRGAVHVSMSTVSPGLSRSLAAEHAAHGQHYVAAPVLGNPDLARCRRLFAIAAFEPACLGVWP